MSPFVCQPQVFNTPACERSFAKLAGAELPASRVIDGKGIWPVLAGKSKSPHKAFFFHRGNQLETVRSGNWKLHIKRGKPFALYNLENDIGDQFDSRAVMTKPS